MKILILLLTVVCWTLPIQSSAIASDNVGVRQIAAFSKERGTYLDVTVWYPASSGGKSVMLGESAFFKGTPAMQNAAISVGKFPLILLSHGAGLAGTAQAVSWIAAPLAKGGFIVAAPTHPGNGGENRSAAETTKLWLRPTDITSALNAIGGASFFKEHLQHNAVGILGLSMGGSTALAVAGARMDEKRLASYCDTDALNPSFCGWVRQTGVDLHAMDLRSSSRDYADKRVRFAMAIDPVPVDVFEFQSFSKVSVPVKLVNLGQSGRIPVTADAAKIAQVIPKGSYSLVEDASHYSMFAECKPNAAQLAEAEQVGDPICADGGLAAGTTSTRS